MIKLIVRVARDVAIIADVLARIDGGDGEDSAGVIEQVPLGCVGPVAGGFMGWSTAGCVWAEDEIDFASWGRAGGGPVGGVCIAVYISLET